MQSTWTSKNPTIYSKLCFGCRSGHRRLTCLMATKRYRKRNSNRRCRCSLGPICNVTQLEFRVTEKSDLWLMALRFHVKPAYSTQDTKYIKSCRTQVARTKLMRRKRNWYGWPAYPHLPGRNTPPKKGCGECIRRRILIMKSRCRVCATLS